MANAKKCDRCGRFYEEKEKTSAELLGDAFADMIAGLAGYTKPNIKNDLCARCHETLIRWWGEGKKEGQKDGRTPDVCENDH